MLFDDDFERSRRLLDSKEGVVMRVSCVDMCCPSPSFMLSSSSCDGLDTCETVASDTDTPITTLLLSARCMSANALLDRMRGSDLRTPPTAFDMVFRLPMIVSFWVVWFSGRAWTSEAVSSSSDVIKEALPT